MLLAEALATLLAGDSVDDPTRIRIGNNVTLLAISVDGQFPGRSDRLAEYIIATAPLDPAEPVLLPGDLELQARASAAYVTLEEPAWHQVVELGQKMGLNWSLEEAGEAR